VDGKGRLVLPSRYRSQLSEQGCVITKGQDGHLMVFPTTVYQEKAAKPSPCPTTRQAVGTAAPCSAERISRFPTRRAACCSAPT
jgi:DNA-binding transcriptional regulator/RsmH inhibitor MraZ